MLRDLGPAQPQRLGGLPGLLLRLLHDGHLLREDVRVVRSGQLHLVQESLHADLRDLAYALRRGLVVVVRYPVVVVLGLDLVHDVGEHPAPAVAERLARGEPVLLRRGVDDRLDLRDHGEEVVYRLLRVRVDVAALHEFGDPVLVFGDRGVVLDDLDRGLLLRDVLPEVVREQPGQVPVQLRAVGGELLLERVVSDDTDDLLPILPVVLGKREQAQVLAVYLLEVLPFELGAERETGVLRIRLEELDVKLGHLG